MNSGWVSVSVGDICEAIFDGPHATPKKTAKGPIFLGISNLRNGQIDLSDVEHLSEEDFTKWTRRVTPQADDIVFSYETRLGEAALVPHGLRFCLGRRMALMRPNKHKVVPRFLLYAYLGPEFQQTLRARTVHGSTVDRIPLVEFPSFPISIPPLPEQRAIAAILGALDDKIELNRRMNRTLESMAQAVFRQWFVSGEGIQGWKVGFLRDIAYVVKGVSYRSVDLVEESDTALVTLKSMERGGGYKEDGLKPYAGEYKPEQKLSPGEVVIAHTYLTQAADVIGRAARIEPSEKHQKLVASLDMAIVRPKEHPYSNEYLYGLLSQTDFSDHAFGYTNGTTVLHLSTKALPEYQFRIPPKNKVEEYSRLVSPSFQRIDSNKKESRTLASLRDTLLPELMRGELRASDVRI